MRLVLLTLALQAPPPAGEGPQPADVVGLAWYGEATGDEAIRQRVRAGLARGAGLGEDAVVEPAVARAREALAMRVDPGDLERSRRVSADLSGAGQAFRGGNPQEAKRLAQAVIDTVRANASIPGAARLAFWSHVLLAQIAWANGEEPEPHLRAAVRIDPGAALSTRYVPPPVAERHAQMRAREMGRHPRWPTPKIELPEGVEPEDVVVEIDGLPGLRPVPAGEHFVVVRRQGMAAEGAYVNAATVWPVPPGRTLLTPELPVEPDDAQVVCDALGLTVLVLARVEGRQTGMQAFRCGKGFATAWVGSENDVEAGASAVLFAPSRGGRSTFTADPPWPHRRSLPPPKPAPGNDAVAERKWYRRPWVWVLIGSLAAAGVATGLAVGLSEGPPDVVVDADDFR